MTGDAAADAARMAELVREMERQRHALALRAADTRRVKGNRARLDAMASQREAEARRVE